MSSRAACQLQKYADCRDHRAWRRGRRGESERRRCAADRRHRGLLQHVDLVLGGAGSAEDRPSPPYLTVSGCAMGAATLTSPRSRTSRRWRVPLHGRLRSASTRSAGSDGLLGQPAGRAHTRIRLRQPRHLPASSRRAAATARWPIGRRSPRVRLTSIDPIERPTN